MGIESGADRQIFLDSNEWGSAATYTPMGGGVASPIQGLFDAAYTDINLGLEVGVASTGPRILVATSNLINGGRQGDQFVIAGVNYSASSLEPDGTGMTNVKLKKT